MCNTVAPGLECMPQMKCGLLNNPSTEKQTIIFERKGKYKTTPYEK